MVRSFGRNLCYDDKVFGKGISSKQWGQNFGKDFIYTHCLQNIKIFVHEFIISNSLDLTLDLYKPAQIYGLGFTKFDDKVS